MPVAVTDTFAGANGTVLSAHAPDLNDAGIGWVTTGLSPAPHVSNGRAAIGAGTGHVQATFNTGTANVQVTVDAHIGSSQYLAGLAFRLTDADHHLVLVAWDHKLEFYQRLGNTYTRLAGNSTPAVAVGSSHRLELRAVGTNLEGWWDGALLVQATATFQQNATRHGLDWNSEYSPATTFDNFELRAPVVPCTYSVSPTSLTIDSTAQHVSFDVTTQAGCAWGEPVDPGFLVRVGPGHGPGSGRVMYAASANTTPSVRYTNLDLADQNIAVTQTAAPPLSSVALTSDRPSPQPLGTPVTWTATPAGGYWPISYKWWQSTNGGQTWSVLRDWTPNASSYVWNPPGAGTQFRISVWARSAGNSNANGEVTKGGPFYTITQPNPVTSVALTADRPSPQFAGSTITWTAAGAGGTTPRSYKWWISSDGGSNWTVLQDWTPNGTTHVWTPMGGGTTYRVAVWVRSAGNGGDMFEAAQAVPFTIENPTPVPSVNLHSDRLSPQPVGRQIRWTAFAGGQGQPLSYKWLVSDSGGGAWSLLQDWPPNASSIFWIPTKLTDQYRVVVWVRSANNTSNDPEAVASRDFATTAAAPEGWATNLTVTSDRVPPQVVGTPITFTAAASGGAGPYTYAWLISNGGGAWNTLQGWSSSPTLVWTPQAAGNMYIIAAWVRTPANTTSAPDQGYYMQFAITATAQNDPPAIAGPDHLGHLVGATVSVPIVATDRESAPLTYAVSGLPPGVTVNSTTGVMTGSITAVGSYAVTASVSDGANTSLRTFSWVVTGGITSGVVFSDHFNEAGLTRLSMHRPDVAPPGSSWKIHGDSEPWVDRSRVRMYETRPYTFAFIDSHVVSGRVGVDIASPSTHIYGGLAFIDRTTGDNLVVVYRGTPVSGFVGLYRHSSSTVQLIREAPIEPLVPNQVGTIDTNVNGSRLGVIWNGSVLFEEQVAGFAPSHDTGSSGARTIRSLNSIASRWRSRRARQSSQVRAISCTRSRRSSPYQSPRSIRWARRSPTARRRCRRGLASILRRASCQGN